MQAFWTRFARSHAMRNTDVEGKNSGSNLHTALDRNIKVNGKLTEALDVVEAQRKKSLDNLLQKKQKFLEETLKRRESIPESYISKNPRSGTHMFKVEQKDIEKNSHLIALERRASANKEVIQPICNMVSVQRMATKWLNKSRVQKVPEKIEEENTKVSDDDKVGELSKPRQTNRRKSLIDAEIETAKLKKQVAFYHHRRKSSLANGFHTLLESDLESLEKPGQRKKTMVKDNEDSENKNYGKDIGRGEMKNKESKKKRERTITDKCDDAQKPHTNVTGRKLSWFEISMQKRVGLASLVNKGIIESKTAGDGQARFKVRKEVIETSMDGIWEDEDADEMSQKRKELNLKRMKHLNKIKLERKAQKNGTRNVTFNEGVKKVSEHRKDFYEERMKRGNNSDLFTTTKTEPSKVNNLIISNYKSNQSQENNATITAGIEIAEQRNSNTMGDDVSEDVIKQSPSKSIMKNKLEHNNGHVDVLSDQERGLNSKIFGSSDEGVTSEAIETTLSSCERESKDNFEGKVTHPFKRGALLKQRRKSVANDGELKKIEVEGIKKVSRKENIDGHAPEPIDLVPKVQISNNTKRIAHRRKSIASLRGLHMGGPVGNVLSQPSGDNTTEGVQSGDGLAPSGFNRRRKSIVTIGVEGISAGLLPRHDVDNAHDIDDLARSHPNEDKINNCSDKRNAKRLYGRRKSIATLRSFGGPLGEILPGHHDGQFAKENDGAEGKEVFAHAGPNTNRRKSITSLALGGNEDGDEMENMVAVSRSRLNNGRRKSIAALPELTNRSEFLVCNSFE